MSEVLNIVFTIDEKFIQHFSVTLTSLLENNKDIEVVVYVIHNVNSLSILENVRIFFYKNYNTELNYITVDDSIFAKYRLSHHISSSAVYFRLLFSDIIPDTVDRILYLDSDTIITGSLKELLMLEFTGKYLMAASDSNEDLQRNISDLNSIGIPTSDYFNSGVMLINLVLWRSENISSKLISIANEYMDRIKWWDQDILNICFYDKWIHLNTKYNALKLTEKCKELPVIIHYNSHTKPWHYLNYHPYKYLYWQYIKLTPFKNAKIQEFKFKRLAKKIIYKFLNKKYKI